MASFGWTRSQRGVLIGLVALLILILALRLWKNPAYVSDPQPDFPARFDELVDKVDPNEADWQTLAALPQLGEKRAKTIVEFREKYLADHPGGVAFTRARDLMQIRGFGAVMVETLEPHLTFPSTQPSTRP